MLPSDDNAIRLLLFARRPRYGRGGIRFTMTSAWLGGRYRSRIIAMSSVLHAYTPRGGHYTDTMVLSLESKRIL